MAAPLARAQGSSRGDRVLAGLPLDAFFFIYLFQLGRIALVAATFIKNKLEGSAVHPLAGWSVG